ncbi:hypothetical protein FACS1894191_6840 [Clostridia bacterium]|nr:hypothetical protein FACS1894191_6840 [Clostridia bacterium]
MNMQLADFSSLNSYVPNNSAFLCFASFEGRCKSTAMTLDKSKIADAYIYFDPTYTDATIPSDISRAFSHCEIKETILHDPIKIADSFSKVIDSLVEKGIENIITDITTFSHEALLILLKIQHSYRCHFKQLVCAYTGAGSYGGETTFPEQKWLSKGCKDVRNVLGYPGILKPASKTCLIVLAGFELERATRLIELIEPDRIAIGNGIEPTNANHTDTMSYFKNRFEEWKNEYRGRNCETFSFSCKDILATAESMRLLIEKNPDDNYILVPLNTKLTTVASALLAIQKPQIQLCYSIPEIYNTNNYSTPGDKITIFDLNSIELFCQ